MAAYEAFAELYDALMDDVDYDSWAEYYLRLIQGAGVKPATLCDCACGTGSMSVRFAARGIRVTGVDRSEEMLAKAQEKARRFGVQAMFACQDMCALALPRWCAPATASTICWTTVGWTPSSRALTQL